MTPTQTSCTIFRGEILQNHYRLALFWTSPISGNLHPRKLRVRHWKSMVWKISRSFWVPAYFQRRTVGFRDGNHKGTLQGTITFPTKQEKENLLHTCLGYWMEIFERSQEGKKNHPSVTTYKLPKHHRHLVNIRLLCNYAFCKTSTLLAAVVFFLGGLLGFRCFFR